MEFRRHKLDADCHTICASSPRCRPNDLRFCHSKGSDSSAGSTEPITWAIHGFGMDRRYSGRRRHASHHPPAVTGPMLFPDPNGRADVFGGFDGQFYQLTMWQWNDSDWTQLAPPTVPFARASAAVATNTSTGQVVMFGGLADVNPNNTWTYDGTTWTLQSPAVQPLLVYAASAAFDPGPARSGSLWRWKRRCRPEHDVVMGSGWRHVDTSVYAAIAARARRCWHDLRRGLTPCDSFRRSG